MDAAAVILRSVNYLDTEVLGALHAACFPEDAWDAAAMAALLATPGTWGLIAVDDGGDPPHPAGLILCRVVLDEAEVLTLGVHPAVRRAGVGHLLLNAAEGEAHAQGATQIFLEVAEDNLPAKTLYAAAGFHQIGMRPRYYRRTQGPAVAALLLSKQLIPNNR